MGDSIDEVMALARSGNRPAARQLVLELLRENPEDVVAMLWLAYTSDSVEEVEVVLNRVLLLDPGNSKALEWQALVRQKQMRMRTGQTGSLSPLPPTPPAPLTPNPRSIYNTPPALNPGPATYNAPLYAQPSPGYSDLMAAQSAPAYPPQPYQPPVSQPLAPWTPQNGQYQVTVAPGPQSMPALPYVQPAPVAPKARPKWPFIVGGIVLCLVVAVGVFFLTSGRLKPGLADYRLFTSLDSLVNDGFVNEQVAVEARFMGGYTKDSNGNYLLIYNEDKYILYVQWNETVTSIGDFRPGQFITIYGRLVGVGGNKATLKADKVTLSNN